MPAIRHVQTLPAPVAFPPGAPKWRFELAELDGDKIGDITGVRDRKVTYMLVKPQTVAFTMDLSHGMMPDLLSRQHVLIKAYRENDLQMVAETTAMQVLGDSSAHSIRVVATEQPWVKLRKRLIGRSAAGVSFTSTDRSYIAAQVLALANAEAATGTNIGGIQPSNSVASAGTWHYKPVLEAITELGAPLNGFDFWFTPVEPTGGNVNSTNARLNIAPVRGSFQANAVFEYGTGKANARAYEWQITLGDRLSRAYALPAKYPNNDGIVVVSSVDSATETAIGRREEVVPHDLGDPEGDFRQMLTDEHIRIRKNPKQIFLIQPAYDDGTGRVPSFLKDYNIGDLVEGRVKDQDLLMLDAWVRVYGAEVSLDDQGAEEITLALVNEE